MFDKNKLFFWRGDKCQCGCGQKAHDAHHCFLPNLARIDTNDERNLVLVNHLEHVSRKFDNRKWKLYFWHRQVERYGEDMMLDWLKSIPKKYHHRFDFLPLDIRDKLT